MPGITPVSASHPSVPATSAAPDPSRPSGTVAGAITGIRNTSESRASDPQQVASSSVSGSNTPAASGEGLLCPLLQSVQKSSEVKPFKRARSPEDDAARCSPPPKKGPEYVPSLQDGQDISLRVGASVQQAANTQWPAPVSVSYRLLSPASHASYSEHNSSIPDMDALFSDEPSEQEKDEYADIILSRAADYSVSEHDREAIKQKIRHAVNASLTYLVDSHTANLIKETLSDAVSLSATFCSVAGYSRIDDGGHKEKIENIRYKNIYEEDADSASGIAAICEAQEDDNGPFVSFSLAPDADSENISSWKLGLIHEVIHHLTGSADPEGEYSQTHLGPTEIIARKIAGEMQLTVPDFAGYDDEERANHLTMRNNAIIGEGARRNQLPENVFIRRLLKLSS